MHYLIDAVVVCCTFCTLLVLNEVLSFIQGLQICKLRSYRLYIAMVHLKLLNLKQVMLPATLPDIESEILCFKNILFAKISLFKAHNSL